MKPSICGPYPFIPITKRPKIRWPNDAALAVWVINNVEFFSLSDATPGGLNERTARKIPSVPHWSYREYGNRVGIWRMMEVFKRHDIKSTVALNAAICDYNPEIVHAGMELGWEFMGHGYTNAIRLNEMPAEEEQAAIKRVFQRIKKETGTSPRGWLSSGMEETWNTLDYLIEEGCAYVADWNSDDQPHLMDVDGKKIVSLPYAWELNDVSQILMAGRSTEEFEGMVRRTFDVLYREAKESGSGRVMAIAVHPFVMGVPNRIDSFDRSLGYVRSRQDVWCATGSEIVDHYLQSGATF